MDSLLIVDPSGCLSTARGVAEAHAKCKGPGIFRVYQIGEIVVAFGANKAAIAPALEVEVKPELKTPAPTKTRTKK